MSMIHDITGSVPRNKKPTRKGRGKSAGKGKTAGRGTKGSGAHGGDVAWKPGHEGGQTPLFRRWPKRGFSNFNFTKRFYVVNVSELNDFAEGTTIDGPMLASAGYIPDSRLPLKILGDGELTKKLTVVAGGYSRTAHDAITKAGGTTQNLKGEAYVFRKQKKHVDPKDAWARKKSSAAGGRKAAPAPVAEEAKPAAPAEEAK